MRREVLISEIIKFCLDYGVLINENEIKTNIENGLSEADFIESLINMIIIKSKKSFGLDIRRVKELLIELEKIRLELEYKDYK